LPEKSLPCIKIRFARAEDRKSILTYLPTSLLFAYCLETIGREGKVYQNKQGKVQRIIDNWLAHISWSDWKFLVKMWDQVRKSHGTYLPWSSRRILH
jgi:hypothetical protein